MSQYAPERDTALSTLLSGTHGRDRREERGIEKIDLQRARRYGMKEADPQGNPDRAKYTYGGIVFIYDAVRRREVTSFPAKDISLATSGTKVAQPVLLDKQAQYELPAAVDCHRVQHASMAANLAAWTSHSVLVVDMSGSMRRDDVNGARCRSDGVWMALARDYVKAQLEKKTRACTDLISVVVMKDRADVVIRAEPTDWVLYNKLLDLREWSTIRPSGPGNYLPALDLAETLLLQNVEGSCALSLLFFSDGKPSDALPPSRRGEFAARMGKIASKFGRRLSVTCVGMAEEGEDFSTLLQMVDEAKAYGAVATFGKPSLDADSLSNIITSLASSLTTSKTEMTELATGKSKTVRMDVRREKIGTPDDAFVTDEWYIYRKEAVVSFWEWSYKLDDFVMVMETRCMRCWAFVAPSRRVHTCPGCRVATYCSEKCFSLARCPEDHGGAKECVRYRSELESGRLVSKDDGALPSFSVAMRKTVFSEGAERMVHKFRFLDDRSNSFIGPKMVAKESRFVDVDRSYHHRMDYHREFMRTQAIASEMAAKFNEALDALSGHFKGYDAVLAKLPRINFLTPLVVETRDPDLGAFAILIEPMLDVAKYEKFNNNMGFVKGQKRGDLLSKRLAHLSMADEVKDADAGQDIREFLGLGAIEEGSEEEDEDDEDGDLLRSAHSTPDANTSSFDLRPEEFPHAFSHFSYQMSKKRLMVVDLQGVFTVRPDGTKVYELTDPVIHKKKSKQRFRHWTFGRTDRGKKGMQAFFETHECSDVCKALGLLKPGMRV